MKLELHHWKMRLCMKTPQLWSGKSYFTQYFTLLMQQKTVCQCFLYNLLLHILAFLLRATSGLIHVRASVTKPYKPKHQLVRWLSDPHVPY